MIILPQVRLMSQDLVHNDKNYLVFVNMKWHQDVDLIVYMKRHPCSSMNLIVYSPNLIFYIHRQGQNFYNRMIGFIVIIFADAKRRHV